MVFNERTRFQTNGEPDTNRNQIKIKDRWRVFLRILLSPSSLIGMILVLFLGYFSAQSLSPTTKVLITALLSVFSGVVGGILANRWNTHFRNTKEQIRAVHLVQDLKTISKIIGGINETAMDVREEGELDSDTTAALNGIEKSSGICRDISATIINYWSDYLPDNEAVRILENIGGLQRRRTRLKEEVERLEAELEAERSRADEKAKREKELQEELQEKKEELSYVREDISEQEDELDEAFDLGAGEVVESDIDSFTSGGVTCQECGEDRDPHLISHEGICVICLRE